MTPKVYYDKHKQLARKLRNNATDAEKKLWQYLKSDQINGCRFLRQFLIGKYIVDFYCSTKKLVIEVDGGQHFEQSHMADDIKRDDYLNACGLTVMRFTNNEVMQNTEGVLAKLYQMTSSRLSP